MIEIDQVSFGYGSQDATAATVPGLEDISLHVKPGECVLLCGPSGCGKSTLLRVMNGLVPHFHPGTLSGTVQVADLEVSTIPLDVTGRSVTTVFQNPRTQFFASRVRDELAFGPENFGIDPDLIRERLLRSAQQTGIDQLLDASLFRLSGGYQQLVSCTAAIVAQPRLYLLDEPTSNLSGQSIERLRTVLLGLRQAGATMVIAEHRLSYLRGIVDRMVLLEQGRIVREWPADQLWAMPEAQRVSLGLRTVHPLDPLLPDLVLQDGSPAPEVPEPTPSGLSLRKLRFCYGSHRVIDIPALDLPRGQVTAVVGPNGAGKSTLTRILVGLERAHGTICLDGRVLRARERTRLGYVVMQDVHRQLFGAEVREELVLGLPHPDQFQERVAEVLAEHSLSELAERHPMSLSGGQKQRLVIAAAQMVDKQIYVFDEPSSGLDYRHLQSTAQAIRSLADQGRVVVVVTHDEELLAACADRIVELQPL